jgi:predicted CopG family antitoxin
MSLRYKTIPVLRDTFSKLEELKERLGMRTWDQLIQHLLETREKFRDLILVKVLCNDLRDASASLPGWWNLLRQRLGDEDLAVRALGYLREKKDEAGIFVVDTSKCKGA